MKKFFVFAATLAAVLFTVSCEKEDGSVGESYAIESDYAVNPMIASSVTKGSANYATKANMETFQIGIYSGKDSDWSANPTTAKTVVESKYTEHERDNNKIWGDGITYYWVEGLTYKFYGVARIEKDSTKTKAYGKSNISKDGIKFTDRAVDANEDLVVAYATGKQGSTQVTNMDFYHALARVRVVASFSADDSVKIKAKFVKWELKNVSTKGSVTIDGSTIKTNNVVWTPNATKANVSDSEASTATSPYLDFKYRNVAGTEIEASGSAQENANKYWVNVLPNASVYADELVATVEFYNEQGKIGTRTLHAKVGGKDLTPKVPELAYASGFKYESGKAYTYKITVQNDGGNSTDSTDDSKNLDGYKIEVKTITVDAWDAADGGTATFQ